MNKWVEYLTGLLHAAELPDTAVVLPSAKLTVNVSTMLRREQPWIGPEPASFRSVPNKPALEFDGHPIWAEFILLRLVERDGWNGVWVKNWGGRSFWIDVLKETELPPAANNLFRRIEKRVGGRGAGCWDVFAWRGDEYLFIESKQHKSSDHIRLTQKNWIEGALDENVPLSSFTIVEWDKSACRTGPD
jgi:hypothetical protein